ncbi:TPA: hypothetical protein ACGTPM_004648 [Salmonella enterica]
MLKKRLDEAANKLAEAVTHHEAELRDIREQQARNETVMQKRLDESGKSASAELKARQTALDKVLKEATEAKVTMTGELKALKSHNEQLVVLLAGKKEPEESGKTKK